MNEGLEELRLRIRPADEGHYLLGLSGGADSVALLMLLLPDIRRERIRAEAVHVNHGLRGEESDGDERFCAELCRREGIRLHICRAELCGRRDEASAREARYAIFRKVYKETGADALILAHHADDQAETFLMRLVRGAGPDGLECMKEEEIIDGIRVLRPMLSLRREEIRDALRQDDIPWREDSSNADTGYLRNRIRYELLPVINRISDSSVEKICRAAGLIGEDNDALNRRVVSLMASFPDESMVNAESLAEEPSAIRCRVLRMWWQKQCPGKKEHSLNAAGTKELEKLLFVPRGKINLPGNIYAVRSGKYLFLQGERRNIIPEPVQVTGTETVFGPYRLQETPSSGNPGDGRRVQEVPPGFTRGCVIRTRRPGDRIRPFGSKGSRKLQDYLTDRHIAEPFRDRIPLLCRGNEVLMAGGVGAGNVPDWNQQDAHVRLTWSGEMPWME